MRDIGKNIRAARVAQNLTQDDLAEKLHTTRQTVSNYETGRSRPDVEMLMQIAETLGVEVTTLLYGVEQPPEQKRERRKFWIAAGVFILLAVTFSALIPVFREKSRHTYDGLLWVFTLAYLMHPIMFGVGWSAMQGAGVFLGAKPCKGDWTRWARVGILAAVVIFILPMTLIWLQAVMAELGFEGWSIRWSSWPQWAKTWMLLGYSFVDAEYRFVMFFLGAGFWMMKRS
ncbi:MAG: helix-turn-helix domain-containing protein [Oscillospiraceae bacterium]|nr:helix-turn-helix domain-containing protein [Oscillospiraceae bacterium]